MKCRIYLYAEDSAVRLAGLNPGGFEYVSHEYRAVPLAPFRWYLEIPAGDMKEAIQFMDRHEFGYFVTEKDLEAAGVK